MKRLTEQVHGLLVNLLHAGDTAIDATAGNGHDTLFLAQQVGSTGCVYAFDIQQIALDQTEQRLQTAGISNVILHRACHSRMNELIPKSHHNNIAAVTFNLGYLPSGDKTVITKPDSSVLALLKSIELLRPGGLITVLCYRGHPGGQSEAEAIETSLRDHMNAETTFERINSQDAPEHSPILFVIRKSG